VRGRDGVIAAETRLERSSEAIAKAREIDIKTAATNLGRGVSGVAPWHLQSALSDGERNKVALEVAEGAYKRKREQVAVVEDDKAEKTNDKLVCIKQVTKPDVGHGVIWRHAELSRRSLFLRQQPTLNAPSISSEPSGLGDL
jgi:hypothetical protein